MKYVVSFLFGTQVSAVQIFNAANRQHAVGSDEPSCYRQELHNEKNTQYYGDVVIGDQTVQAIFDTGSFELLVMSTLCKSCAETPYDHTKSDHYEASKDDAVMEHQFGSGPTVSTQSFDEVKVGPFVSDHQMIWEILDHQIEALDYSKFHAIVGIGHDHAPESEAKTLLMNFGVKEFSVCLERGDEAPGWLTWGNPAHCETHHLEENKFEKVPVVGQIHWAAHMHSLGLAAKEDERVTVDACSSSCAAIVDSGTSLLAAPRTALLEMSDKIGNIELDCSNLQDLPDLTFILGETEFVLPPEAYIMKMPKPENMTIPEIDRRGFLQEDGSKQSKYVEDGLLPAVNTDHLFFFDAKKSQEVDADILCVPAFMAIDMTSEEWGDVWILGMPFLRYYYTRFDRQQDDKFMHFAQAGEGCAPEPFHGAPQSFTQLSVEEKAAKKITPVQMSAHEILVPSWSKESHSNFQL